MAENREYLDWYLMQKFPGRTLEELDTLDWLRLQRALEVGRIVELEQRHVLVMNGKLKADALNAWEWAQVRRNTALYEDSGGGDE